MAARAGQPPLSNLLYDEKDELYDIELGKTRDRKILVLGIEAKDTTEMRYLRADRSRRRVRPRWRRVARVTATISTTAKACSTSALIATA